MSVHNSFGSEVVVSMDWLLTTDISVLTLVDSGLEGLTGILWGTRFSLQTKKLGNLNSYQIMCHDRLTINS